MKYAIAAALVLGLASPALADGGRSKTAFGGGFTLGGTLTGATTGQTGTANSIAGAQAVQSGSYKAKASNHGVKVSAKNQGAVSSGSASVSTGNGATFGAAGGAAGGISVGSAGLRH